MAQADEAKQEVSVKSRAQAAILGGIIADAAALPLHWIYDEKTISGLTNGRSDLGFYPEPKMGFYKIPVGRQSVYGEVYYTVLKSINWESDKPDFDINSWKKTITEHFTFENLPSANVEKFNEKGDAVDKNPKTDGLWYDGPVKAFLGNTIRKKEVTGGALSDLDGSIAAMIITCVYAARMQDVKKFNDIEKVLLNVMQTLTTDVVDKEDPKKTVRITQFGLALSYLLWLILFQVEPNEVKLLEKLAADGKGKWDDVIPYIVKAQKAEKMAYRRRLQQKEDGWGSWCTCPVSFLAVMYNFLNTSYNYTIAVSSEIAAGGDNCSRAIVTGMLTAALGGSTNVIPQKWVESCNYGAETVKLVAKL